MLSLQTSHSSELGSVGVKGETCAMMFDVCARRIPHVKHDAIIRLIDTRC
jgi:hypothetical protein